MKSRNVSLTFLVKKNGFVVTTKNYNLECYTGKNEFSVYLNSNLNSDIYYDFEIKYDGRIIYIACK